MNQDKHHLFNQFGIDPLLPVDDELLAQFWRGQQRRLTATLACVLDFARGSPLRARRHPPALEFHWGKPPPAAAPSIMICMERCLGAQLGASIAVDLRAKCDFTNFGLLPGHIGLLSLVIGATKVASVRDHATRYRAAVPSSKSFPCAGGSDRQPFGPPISSSDGELTGLRIAVHRNRLQLVLTRIHRPRYVIMSFIIHRMWRESRAARLRFRLWR